MRVVLIFALVCALGGSTLAQNGYSVSGSVTNMDGVVAGALVTLTSKGESRPRYSQITDARGFFGFYAASGTYLLTATRTSGEISEFSGPVEVKVNAAEHVRQDLRLTAATIREFVSISADTAQPIEEVSKTVNVITGQEMRDRADFTLIDTLRTIPGLRVQQFGGFGRLADIKTRGLRKSDTAVLIDGIRFRDAASDKGDASSYLSDLTLTSVSRIEVLRGSGSSLYGTNSIGGTIDFRTPEPKPGFHGQVSGAAGGLGLGRLRANISDGTKDGLFGFNAAISRTVYRKGIDGEDDAHNTNFQNRIEFKRFSKTNLSARFFVSDAYVRLNNSPIRIGPLPASPATVIAAVPLSQAELHRYEQGTPIAELNLGNANVIPDANDPDSFQKSQSFSGQVVLTHVLTRGLVFHGHYQGLRTARRNTNGILGVGSQPFSGAEETSIFRGDVHTLNTNFSWTPNDVHKLTAGYEYEREKFSNRDVIIDPIRAFSAQATQSSNTVYVQYLVSLFDGRLQFSGSVRAQVFSLGNPQFLPVDNPTYHGINIRNPPNAFVADGSASYFFPSTDTKVRAHVGNGYRVPALYERFGSFRYGQFSSLGDPNLKPERSIAWDAGIEQYFASRRFKLTATYFYTDIQTSIDFAFCVPRCLPPNDPLGRYSGYYNTEGRIARGLETSGEAKLTDSTSIFASYTFINSDERHPLNLAVRTSSGVPAHQLTAVVTQRIGKHLWVNFDFVGTSSYLFPFYHFDSETFAERYYIYRFNGSRRADITAGYTFPLKKESLNLRIFGTIENLFDHRYYDNGFRTPGRNGRAGLSLGF